MKVEPREADEELLAILEKKLDAVRAEAAEQRKIEAARNERIKSRRASPAVNRVGKELNKGHRQLGKAKQINKGEGNWSSWYLKVTKQVHNTNKDVASDAKQSKANGKSVRTQEAEHKGKNCPAEEDWAAHSSAHNSGTKGSGHTDGTLLDKLHQLLQGIKNILMPRQSQQEQQSDVSYTSHRNGKLATQRWNTPILVDQSAHSSSHQPPGPLLHRPVEGSATRRCPTSTNKAESQTETKWENKIRDQMGSAKSTSSGREGAVKMNKRKYGMKKPIQETSYGNIRGRANPWLARRKIGRNLQNTMIKVKRSRPLDQPILSRDSSRDNPNQMQRQQQRLFKRGMESRN